MDPTLIGDYITTTMSDRFVLVSTVTFFICEGIFNALPIHSARYKQLTSVIVGGILGILFIQDEPLMAMAQGLMAGGATTITVAKFKKPRTSSGTPVVAPPAATPSPVQPQPFPPVEHDGDENHL